MALDSHIDEGVKPVTIEIHLTVDEQRRLAQAEAGGPCFRMWMTPEEWKRGSFADWTAYALSDGRIAIWRKTADVEKLMCDVDTQGLWRAIMERKLPDEVV